VNSPHNKVEPAKQVFYGQALLTACCSGTYLFLNSLLTTQNLSVIMLQCTPFLIVTTIAKIIIYNSEAKTALSKGLAKPTFKDVFIRNYIDPKTRALDLYFTISVLFRNLISGISIYSAVRSVYYANLANINFGIISCC
jgi:hypothetical protein